MKLSYRADGKGRKPLDICGQVWYNIVMKKEIIKVKVNQTELPNKMHFEIQRRTRAQVYRDRTKYTRRRKHKNQEW